MFVCILYDHCSYFHNNITHSNFNISLICTQGNAGRATSISSFVSSFGKNVRKYAEVGFQRLVVALPSRLSSEELEEYVLLVTKLCEKCQVGLNVSMYSVCMYVCFYTVFIGCMYIFMTEC